MATNQELLNFVSIFEKDIHGDVTTSWIYPEFPGDFQQVLLNRTQIKSEKPEEFIFSRFGGLWHYSYVFAINRKNVKDKELLKFAEKICISIGAKQFYPERYFEVLKSFSSLYVENKGIPAEVLNNVFSLATDGVITVGGKPAAIPSNDEKRKALIKIPLTDISNRFGKHTLLLWHALLTRRSLLIKGTNTLQLLDFVRALPLLAFHRQDWSILRPLITASDIELKDLSLGNASIASTSRFAVHSSSSSENKGGIVCGSTNEAVEGMYLWDFVADLGTNTIIVRELTEEEKEDQEQAEGGDNEDGEGRKKKKKRKQTNEEEEKNRNRSFLGPLFEMTPFHKEAAGVIKSAKSSNDLVMGLTNLTKKILSRIEEIKGEIGDGQPFIYRTVKAVLEGGTPAAIRFLVNLDLAENG